MEVGTLFLCGRLYFFMLAYSLCVKVVLLIQQVGGQEKDEAKGGDYV